MTDQEKNDVSDKAADLAKRTNDQMKRFRRLRGRKWVGGVCSGLAYRFGLPTWAVRLAWTLLVLCKGFGLLPYVLLWIFVPASDETPEDYPVRTGDR